MADPKMMELMKNFILTDAQLQQVYDLLYDQINKGLMKDTVSQADTKCFITYVHNLPNGKEVGKFLALDLGGTNFRVLLLILNGKKEPEMFSEIFTLTKEIITGDGNKLFDYIAHCLYTFTKGRNVNLDKLPIGFTFSFPCFQESLEIARLVRWTKGFSASGVVGEDVARLLKEAIARQSDLEVGHIAVLNDTTGTLMSCAHKNPNCKIGLIIGTGCNACYLERITNTDKIGAEFKECYSHVIINLECGAFGDSGYLDFIRTDFDKQIDAPTLNPGFQLYEKLISGMYLGGLVALNLQKAIEMGLIFGKCSDRNYFVQKLASDPDCFKTSFLSEMASDKTGDFNVARRIFKELFDIDRADKEDCKKLLYICTVIAERSAKLAAVELASLVNRINDPFTVIGIDGSVYRYHPDFDRLLHEQMDKMVRPKLDYELMLSEDGSGRGAALVAATCC